MEKYRSKYRIESTRLRNWNYSTPGFYFIIFCTRNREHFFGEIQDGKMFLNEIGKIADDYWSQIPLHFQNAELGDYIIMPNHIHGIIVINGMDADVTGVVNTWNVVETGHALSLRSNHQSTKSSSNHLVFATRVKIPFLLW